MPLGLTVSILLHTALLAWAFLSFKAVAELPAPETPAINVELITPSELLRLKKGSETAKELEAQAKDNPEPPVSKTEAEKPKPVAAPPPPEEQSKPEPEKQQVAKAEPPPEPPKPESLTKPAEAPPPPPEPAPGPTPEEKKALEQKLEQERKEDERKKAEEQKKKDDELKKKEEEKKKAEEKKKKDEEKKKKLAEAKKKAEKQKKFDADRIAALLDKTPDKKGAPQSATQPSKPTEHKGPTAGTRDGRDSVLSLREQDMLKGQISGQLRGCWRLPGGGGGIETMVVTLRWRLTPTGELDGEPTVVDPQGGPVFSIAAEAAIRAVKQCSPFDLPADKYSAWKTIIWDFDPREMI